MSSANEEKVLTMEEGTASTEPVASIGATETRKEKQPAPAETTADVAKEGNATDTTPNKPAKIFGSFTSEAQTETSKEATPSKPLFGGFTGIGSTSAWTVPATFGGFGAPSSFGQPQSSMEDKEEVTFDILCILAGLILVGRGC